MFFSKKDKDESKRVVAVVGTSPLALFLTCVLQQNNIDVIVVNTLRKNKSEKEESWFLKNGFHGQSFSFSSCDALKKKPDYCFLASSFDEYKSDVLFLSDNMLRDVPVINFASFYNHKIHPFSYSTIITLFITFFKYIDKFINIIYILKVSF